MKRFDFKYEKSAREIDRMFYEMKSRMKMVEELMTKEVEGLMKSIEQGREETAKVGNEVKATDYYLDKIQPLKTFT